MNAPGDTIAAIATPLGQGGLGVIRASGPQAIGLAMTIFQPLRPFDFAKASGPTCHLGRIRTIDEAILTIFHAPRSYTGEDVVEISAHGGPYILREILDLCFRNGARPAEPGEFTLRAFLNGKLDLTQAEAVAELIHARTQKTHQAALAQHEGRLSAEVRRLREALLPLLAHVEVGLDHSDEDHDFLSRSGLQENCAAVVAGIETILASARSGKILREGWRVALVGRPNVGKSSLLNALLKEERAIVTPIPGTTRDTLEEPLDCDGLPVLLIDTAGLRDSTNDAVEALGMERTRRAAVEADLVIALVDVSQPLTDEDRAVLASLAGRPHLVVLSKNDLPRRLAPQEQACFNGMTPVEVSAQTGDGLPALRERIREAALREFSSGEAAWLLNARHRDALARTRDALDRALKAGARKAFEEVVALELRAALDALGEITGETTSDDVLDRIFSQFCIGK